MHQSVDRRSHFVGTRIDSVNQSACHIRSTKVGTIVCNLFTIWSIFKQNCKIVWHVLIKICVDSMYTSVWSVHGKKSKSSELISFVSNTSINARTFSIYIYSLVVKRLHLYKKKSRAWRLSKFYLSRASRFVFLLFLI